MTTTNTTLTVCLHAWRWQRINVQDQSDPPGYWAVATFDPESVAFITDDGRRLRPRKGIYTYAAWERFRDRLGYHPEISVLPKDNPQPRVPNGT